MHMKSIPGKINVLYMMYVIVDIFQLKLYGQIIYMDSLQTYLA